MRLWAPQAQGYDLSILIYSPLQCVWDASRIPLSLPEYKALTPPAPTSPLFQLLLPWPFLLSFDQLCTGVAWSQLLAMCILCPVPGLLSWVSHSWALILAQPEVWEVNTDGQVLTKGIGADASHCLPPGAQS